jgi:hypothetical protein
MVGKIRIVSRGEGRIIFDLKDGEYTGKYMFLESDDGEIFECIYHNNMLIPTGRAQYIAAALAGVIRGKTQEI